jgi:hypothetical protein
LTSKQHQRKFKTPEGQIALPAFFFPVFDPPAGSHYLPVAVSSVLIAFVRFCASW